MANKPSQPEAPVAKFDHPTTGFENFLEENLKMILIAGAVIFVGVMGYLAFAHFSEKAAAEEANAFTSAATIEEYRKVISEYPGSLAAGNSQLMIAKKLAGEEDKRADAISELKTFIESYGDHPQHAQGQFLLGTLLIEDGDAKAAEAEFDKLIGQHADSYLAPYAKLYKGDFAFAAGDTETAKKIYEGVLREHQEAEASERADERLDLIKVAPPEIVEAKPESATINPDDGAR